MGRSRSWIEPLQLPRAVTAAGCMTLLVAGCSSNPSTQPGQPNTPSTQASATGPCSMATTDQISQAIGQSVIRATTGPPDGPNGCQFDDGKFPGGVVVQITIYNTAAFDQAESSQCKTSGPGEAVSGIGMEAMDCSPILFVRIGQSGSPVLIAISCVFPTSVTTCGGMGSPGALSNSIRTTALPSVNKSTIMALDPSGELPETTVPPVPTGDG
jgi:hypothetical protein